MRMRIRMAARMGVRARLRVKFWMRVMIAKESEVEDAATSQVKVRVELRRE